MGSRHIRLLHRKSRTNLPFSITHSLSPNMDGLAYQQISMKLAAHPPQPIRIPEGEVHRSFDLLVEEHVAYDLRPGFSPMSNSSTILVAGASNSQIFANLSEIFFLTPDGLQVPDHAALQQDYEGSLDHSQDRSK